MKYMLKLIGYICHYPLMTVIKNLQELAHLLDKINY